MSDNKSDDNNSEKQKFSRTQPFIETNIADITTPGRYKIVGTVVNSSKDSFVIEDGTEQLSVSFTDVIFEKPEEGDQVRVLGYLEFEPEKLLKAAIIQNLTNINLETYRQIRDLEFSLRKDDE